MPQETIGDLDLSRIAVIETKVTEIDAKLDTVIALLRIVIGAVMKPGPATSLTVVLGSPQKSPAIPVKRPI